MNACGRRVASAAMAAQSLTKALRWPELREMEARRRPKRRIGLSPPGPFVASNQLRTVRSLVRARDLRRRMPLCLELCLINECRRWVDRVLALSRQPARRGCALKVKCCPNTPERKVPRSIHEAARDKARAIAQSEAVAARALAAHLAEIEGEGYAVPKPSSLESAMTNPRNPEVPIAVLAAVRV